MSFNHRAFVVFRFNEISWLVSVQAFNCVCLCVCVRLIYFDLDFIVRVHICPSNAKQ